MRLGIRGAELKGRGVLLRRLLPRRLSQTWARGVEQAELDKTIFAELIERMFA
ncbi:MAG TPA: hypothetical protein VLM36_11895 [Sphingomicrobium sp.]|nr:hypothetical protein [Sphingomicrobium sp.]